MLTKSDRVVITLLLLTAQATDLKAANIQVFEALVVLLLPYLVLRYRGLVLKESLLVFGPMLLFFFFTAFYCALKVEFFPPPGMGVLKQPLIISLVRLVQFSLIFLAFNHFRISLSTTELVTWAARRYVDVSYWIAIPTIASFVLSRATGRIFPLVYDTASYLAGDGDGFGKLRAKGLFVEGGPYGLSLIASLVLATVIILKGGKIPWHKMAILSLAMLVAQSKAAFLCIVLLLGIYFIRFLKLRTFLIMAAITASAALGAFTLQWSLIEDLKGYYSSIQTISEGAVDLNPEDGNNAFGRVAGIFIAPRMAADNLLLGVGLGNYSLTRNNPKYLGPMPQVEGWDLPGLGLMTLILEGGLIGLFLMLLSYFLFYRATMLRNPQPALNFLFLCPLLLQVCGVQFYFAYHWLFLLLLVGMLSDPASGYGGARMPLFPRAPSLIPTKA